MRFLPFTDPIRLPLALGLALGVAIAPAAAQQTPANGQLPQTLPGLDNFTIAPRSPLGVPTPTPTPSAAPSRSDVPQVVPIAPLPVPSPKPTLRAPTRPATAKPTPAPTPTATPIVERGASPATAATAQPLSTPTPAASVPISQPTPVVPATPTPAISTPRPAKTINWLWALLILPLVAAGAWFWRRRSSQPDPLFDQAEQPATDDAVATIPPPPAPAAPRPMAARARPRLAVDLQPRRAGLNLTSIAVDYELTVVNDGPVDAEAVEIAVTLLTAGTAHDAGLQALFENAPARLATPVFTLAAGERRTVRAMALQPKEAAEMVNVRDRPMVVPILAVDIRYRWNGEAGQTARSFVIGLAPEAGDRMRPLWLDVPPRMYDAAVARPHAVSITR